MLVSNTALDRAASNDTDTLPRLTSTNTVSESPRGPPLAHASIGVNVSETLEWSPYGSPASEGSKTPRRLSGGTHGALEGIQNQCMTLSSAYLDQHDERIAGEQEVRKSTLVPLELSVVIKLLQVLHQQQLAIRSQRRSRDLHSIRERFNIANDNLRFWTKRMNENASDSEDSASVLQKQLDDLNNFENEIHKEQAALSAFDYDRVSLPEVAEQEVLDTFEVLRNSLASRAADFAAVDVLAVPESEPINDSPLMAVEEQVRLEEAKNGFLEREESDFDDTESDSSQKRAARIKYLTWAESRDNPESLRSKMDILNQRREEVNLAVAHLLTLQSAEDDNGVAEATAAVEEAKVARAAAIATVRAMEYPVDSEGSFVNMYGTEVGSIDLDVEVEYPVDEDAEDEDEMTYKEILDYHRKSCNKAVQWLNTTSFSDGQYATDEIDSTDNCVNDIIATRDAETQESDSRDLLQQAAFVAMEAEPAETESLAKGDGLIEGMPSHLRAESNLLQDIDVDAEWPDSITMIAERQATSSHVELDGYYRQYIDFWAVSCENVRQMFELL